MTAVIADVLLVLGAVFLLLAAIGMLRFQDVLARMHALSKGSNFGLILVLAGGAVGLDLLDDISFVVLAAGFQLLTAPVATHLISRATYRAANATTRVDATDDLGMDGDPPPATGHR